MLEIRKLDIRYGQKLLLKETSLQLEKGKVYTISGVSGVGKSSLLNKIGLIATDLGQMIYSYDGRRLNLSDEKQVSDFIATHIGFIFQEKNLLRHVNVYDNIALLLNNAQQIVGKDDRIDHYLEELGLSDKKYAFPYDLSGGEEQRVAIARALIADKDIILADEPTNSLDKDNRKKITDLLVDLAHRYQKIVVIVSHDDEVIDRGDVHLRLSNQTIEKVFTKEVEKQDQCLDKEVGILQKIDLPKRKFPIPKIVTGLLVCFIAISTLLFNITGLFQSHYQTLLDHSLENGLLAIKDTLDIKGKQVYDDFLSFTDKEISNLKQSDVISQVNPYLEFPYKGITLDTTQAGGIDVQPEVTVNGKTVALKSPYSIQPLFPTNMTERNIEYIDRTATQGLIVSESFLASQNLGNEISGQTKLTLDYYVPIALYKGQVTKSTGEIVDSDGDIFVKQRREFPIIGILKDSYPFQYSVHPNSFFMRVNEMLSLQEEAKKGVVLPDELGGLPVAEWRSSAYHITVANSTDVPGELSRLKKMPHVTTVSSSEDYQSLKHMLSYVRTVSTSVAVLILSLMILCLFFVFFQISNTRKEEVGILKALGFSSAAVRRFYYKELTIYTRSVCVMSLVMSVVLVAALAVSLQLKQQDVLAVVMRNFLTLPLVAFGAIVTSGLVPIYKACQTSPVDCIRLNR
ncbi:ABC transporter ATP-binding protein/permease [Streptococcus ruminantium]|nr:ATP-binding cassette domain-containing protein [Streptococcus ruminantium]